MEPRSILERRCLKRSQPARKANVVRLAVEALEDRTVLSGFGGEGISHDPNDWPMFGHDARGTRYNFAEHRLGPDNVDDLEVKWTFPTDGPLAGTPAVVNNVVYAADLAGTVYALSRDGDLLWRTTLNVPSLITAKIATGPLVTNRTVVIGDLAGQIHGLDIDDGEVRWTIRPGNGPLFPDGHPFQQILAAGTMVGKYVAFGISTNESLIPLFNPDYPGFTFRGNVVLIDPADGRLVWQTFFVDVPTLQPDGDFGPSGATVWSSPAYDHASKTIFVGTGQNFSQPTTETSDALIALDAADGSIKWIAQKMPGDDFNFGDFPPAPGETVDADFGDSPQLYRLNGRLVVAAGQKSGFFHVLDAETGAPVATPKQFLAHGLLGGFHIDSGYANGINYATGNDWPGAFLGLPPEGASLFAISADGTEQLWKFDVDSAILSGVAIANGVVYVQEIDGDFWAVDAETGSALKHLFTGGSASGAAVSRGQIYLGTGNVLAALFDPFAPLSPGSIVALGLPEQHGHGSGQGHRHGNGRHSDHSDQVPGDVPFPSASRPAWLDAHAAGWGWFVDPTPWDDSEFTTPGDQGEQHRMDLLTVIAHEVGHLLGYDHEDHGVMAESLMPGTRQAVGPAGKVNRSHPVDLLFALVAADEETAWLDNDLFGRRRQK
jgi:polyvinyl alcohol dehydrogenase (cytochrome)